MGYLVISRKVGERIKIGDDIEILITHIEDKKIEIGIQAPKKLTILRLKTHLQELKDMKNKGNFNY